MYWALIALVAAAAHALFFRDDGSELTYGVILFVLYLVAAMLGRRLFDELEE